MFASMTAQGWRKRQIIDHADTVDHAQDRIKVLETENAAMKALLIHSHYFVTHYGTTNTLTELEKKVKASFLSRINTYTADPLKNPATGL